MKTKFNSNYKPKIKTKKNGNICYKGSLVDGLLFLNERKLLEQNNTEQILTIEIFPRYILFGETMIQFEIKNK